MRLIHGFLILLLTSTPAPSVAGAPIDEAGSTPAPADDLLGELVVEAKRRGQLVLPKVAVVRPPDGSSALHDLLERDLELSGEFSVVALDTALGFDDPIDAEALAALGLEAVITAETRQGQGERGPLELAVRVYLPAVGELVAWSKTVGVAAGERRLAGHRLSDGIIGALTGTDGPFASRLVLVRTEGKQRHAYLVDADGKGLTRLSPDDQLVVTATLDRDARPVWAASSQSGRYRLYAEGHTGPIPVEPRGSIYAIAFAPNGTDVALSIARGTEIQVFGGPLGGAALTARTQLDFALTPSFAPDGRLVYAGTRGKRRAIYVESKPVSPKQLAASSPTVCAHPDGPLLIYAVGLGKHTDLVSSALDGANLARLSQGRGRNYAPACSPDGRLVAFFSTRTQDEGPGLYLMRTDGRRAKRINAALGDVLAWARIPTRAPRADDSDARSP